MVFVMRTDVENLVSRETQWKKTSVYENTVSSISLLLLLVIYSISMHLFDDFFKNRYDHAKVGP